MRVKKVDDNYLEFDNGYIISASDDNDQVNKQYGYNPFLHVSPSKVVHNVPYYIAGNNPDFSEDVATKSATKMLNKFIPGVEKVPYYLEDPNLK